MSVILRYVDVDNDFEYASKVSFVSFADCYLNCEQVAAKAKSLGLLKKIADPEFIFTVVLLARSFKACDEVLTARDRFRSWLSGTQDEESGSFQAVSTEAANHARTATENLYRTRETRPLEPEAPEFDNLKAPIYDRFLQSLVDRLDHQFGSHFALAASISNLLPHRVPSVSFNDIAHIVDFYAESKAITSKKDYIKSQFEHWKAKCSRMPATLCGGREAIRRCRVESTPDIHKLLLIYATIPVSSAATERSFSGMKRLKSYLRSTMTEQRLTGLALAHSHKDVPISTESVLEKMEKRKRRRYMPIVPVPKKPRIALMDDAEAENPPDSSEDAFLCLSDDSNE
ncbi:repressor of the inhibitor of the kinase-like protein [Aphelenchoides avenae]|nr:repressor of the inhibitor of the kinase-like protein [Aphelenchus avenae]